MDSDYFGTTIYIMRRAEDHTKTKMDLLYAKDLLHHSISVAQADLPLNEHLCLQLDGKTINTPEISPEDIIYEVTNPKTGKYDFRIRKRKNKFMQSYVTTGGIPFGAITQEKSWLPSSLLSEISSGYVLDVGLNVYKPVQSRTKLQIKPEKMKALKRFLLDSYYIIGIEAGKENDNFLNNNFTHFGSRTSDFGQLLLSARDNTAFQAKLKNLLNQDNLQNSFNQEDFFTYYKPSWSNKSFFEMIKDGYKNFADNIRNRKFNMERKANRELGELKEAAEKKPKQFRRKYNAKISNYQEDFKKWVDSKFKHWKEEISKKEDPHEIIEHITIPWFERKIKYIELELKQFLPTNSPELQTKEEKERTTVLKEKVSALTYSIGNIKGVNQLLLGFFNEYCFSIMKKNNISKKLFSSVEFEYMPHTTTTASYNPMTKKIMINLAYVQIRDLIDAMLQFLTNNDESLTQIKVLKEFFIPQRNHTPNLVHELEHVRREQNPNQSNHAQCVNPNGKKVDFDVCANSYVREAIRDGALEDWRQSVISNTRYSTKRDLEELLEWIDKNVKSENDQVFLLKKLGLIN